MHLFILSGSPNKASLFQAVRWWGRRESERYAKSWRGGAGWFPPVFFFSCSRFLNSADPTISEPGTGKTKLSTYVPYMCNSKPVIRIVGASCPPKLITLMLYYFQER